MNKTNNPLSSQRIEHKKESLNSDGQHLHQYEQNKKTLSSQRIEHKKESFNSDGQHLHQYEQNKQSTLTPTH
jgi:hypothetical protein